MRIPLDYIIAPRRSWSYLGRRRSSQRQPYTNLSAPYLLESAALCRS